MANLKNIMIDCLRDGTEIETVWKLRRSFLHKNLNVNDSSEFKDHIIMLSHCFVSVTLGNPHDYLPNVVQEAQSRSRGLEGNVNNALYEIQDSSYQAKQMSAVAAASTFYQHPQATVPFNYNKVQSGQQQMQYNGSATHYQSTNSNFFSGQGQVHTPPPPFGQVSESATQINDQVQQNPSLSHGKTQQGAFLKFLENQKASGQVSSNSTYLYGQSQSRLGSSYGQNSTQDFGSFGRSQNQSPATLRTQYVSQDPSVSSYSGDKYYEKKGILGPPPKVHDMNQTCNTIDGQDQGKVTGLGSAFPKRRGRMVDTNALSIIPMKKSHPNKGVPGKKALKREKQRLAMALKVDKTREAMECKIDKPKMKEIKIGCPVLVSMFKPQPLFDKIKTNNISTVKPIASNKDGSTMDKYAFKDWVKQAVPLNDESHKSAAAGDASKKTKHPPDFAPKDCAKDKEITPATSHSEVKEDDSPELIQKLVPIFDMANCYSSLDIDATDPFAALQKCAAGAKQKVKCVSKSTLNSEGCKELTCSVFANEICIVSVPVAAGTDPVSAKKKLAEAVLEKISLPHLRLISDADGVLKLEGSNSAFTDEKCGNDSGTENCGNTLDTSDTKPVKIKEDQQSLKAPYPQQRKNTVCPPLKPTSKKKNKKCPEFDTFFAWKYEKHPELKKVRQLGHMLATLPYQGVPIKQRLDHAGILQLFANVVNFQFEIKENEKAGNSHGHKYSFVMDEKIHLFSWDVSSGNPSSFISRSVLKKVSMPYLCLVKNVLHASNVPFKDKQDFEMSADIVLDISQTDEVKKLKECYKAPLRIEDFCLFDSQKSNFHNLEISAMMNRKYFLMKSVQTKSEKLAYFTLDGQVVGGMVSYNECLNKKKARNSGSEACFRYLRKCHWTIQRLKKLKESYYVYPDDVLPQLQAESTSNALQDNNKGYQLLAKMGWSGGGIGLKEDGIAEPIRSGDMLSKNSGLGYKKLAATSNFNKLVDLTNTDHKKLLEAYNDSKLHRDLFIVASKPSVRGLIFEHVEKLNMKASTRGLQRNKRVVVSKKIHAPRIITDCVELGGQSDLFVLIPPQEEDYQPPMDLFLEAEKGIYKIKVERKRKREKMAKNLAVAANRITKQGKSSDQMRTMSKTIQCNLLKAPILERFKPAESLCDIEYDLDSKEVENDPRPTGSVLKDFGNKFDEDVDDYDVDDDNDDDYDDDDDDGDNDGSNVEDGDNNDDEEVSLRSDRKRKCCDNSDNIEVKRIR